MFVIYQFFISLILIISPLIIFIRLVSGKEDKKRFKEKFSLIDRKSLKGKTIWFHAASVGEIMSIVEILRYYQKKRDIKTILVTTTTLSSARIVKKLKLNKVIHQFFPIDHFIIVKKFLNHWKPKIAIFLESEIWPSMFYQLFNKNIPLILLNARLTKKSFDRWMIIKNFAKKIFSLIKKSYPQNQQTKFFLKKLSSRNSEQLGNLKFINNKLETKNISNKKIIKNLAKYKVWVAASTHQGEELLAAKTHILLKKKQKNLITIIIPRHLDKIHKIVNEIKKLNLNVTTYSSNQKNFENTDIYIVDTFGLSRDFYAIASTVFLGKSIFYKGGQNPLEAARLNCNILHGPNVDNFRDIYKYLHELKIAKKVNSISDLISRIEFRKNYTNAVKLNQLGNKIYKQTIKELDSHIN
jgi:3-deoxy-D-manno-octulosonic-acid transferase